MIALVVTLIATLPLVAALYGAHRGYRAYRQARARSMMKWAAGKARYRRKQALLLRYAEVQRDVIYAIAKVGKAYGETISECAEHMTRAFALARGMRTINEARQEDDDR